MESYIIILCFAWIYICMYVNGKNFVDKLPALNLFSFSLSN